MLSGWREQGFGVGPISHQEIVAWAWLYRVRPSPAEVTVLRDLDIALRDYHNKKNNSDGKSAEVVSSTHMTPELFDSLFR